jgi:hypothetical protein
VSWAPAGAVSGRVSIRAGGSVASASAIRPVVDAFELTTALSIRWEAAKSNTL